MKRLAIIGAGFCGLAIAWHALHEKKYSVTLFDSNEIGKNASGISAGLLHGYTGPRARSVKNSKEGLESSLYLLTAASMCLEEPVFKQTGLLRLALTPQQQNDFYSCSQQHEDVDWWEPQLCQEKVPGIAKAPGIFIHHAYTVDTQKYLKGLWAACQMKDAILEKRFITSLEELDSFDKIVVAGGAGTLDIPNLQLPLNRLKGQILEIEWPHPPLPFPVSSQAYFVNGAQPDRLIIGATFERNYQSTLPNIPIATEKLFPKIQEVFPSITQPVVLHCRSGLRATTTNHLPLLRQLDSKTWLLTGMGSKGLLYHAFYARMIIRSLR